MTVKPYTYDEVAAILDTVERDGENFDVAQASQDLGRTKDAIRIVLFMARRMQTDPEHVKKVSGNMYRLLSDYYARKERQDQKQSETIELAAHLDRSFTDFQKSVNTYIDAMVAEQTTDLRKQLHDVTLERDELQEFKKGVQGLLGQ